MGRVRTAALAGAGILASTATFAADMPPPLPPLMPPPPIEEVSSGWYLRGDIGVSSQEVKSLHNDLYSNAASVTATGHSFDSAGFFGIGVGVNYNSWLRFDVTGEYRANANFKGSDRSVIDPATRWVQHNDYTASKSEWLFLANAYVDLGTWWCLTPFVGAGIGFSRNTISAFRDMGMNFSDTLGFWPAGPGFADEASTWSFAWALHAGLAYKASENVTFELAYRYVNLGDAVTGETYNLHGVSTRVNPFEFRELTSHDVKFGVRFSLDPTPAPAPMPVAFPPPLMRRG